VSAFGKSKLALGGAQFGMRYGIANSSGQPSSAMVDQILRKAKSAGILMIDTAHAYGESEAVLGLLIGRDRNFRIVTKTRPIRAETIEKVDVVLVLNAFQASLDRLNRESVYALLVHDANDLLVKGGERLWAWMRSVQSEGKVQKIGVSVYSPEQLQEILDRDLAIEIVQLPFNIYDQRFARSGLLDRLKQDHVEIHSRSAFLQGLLLMAPKQLPNQFSAISRHQEDLWAWFRARGMSPLAGALAVCINDPRIDFVVVGCDSLQQFEEITAVANTNYLYDLDRFAISDETIINPSLWANRN
jgi:aryl-alcohol dehydrogenase-like predicted oxidoreductase